MISDKNKPSIDNTFEALKHLWQQRERAKHCFHLFLAEDTPQNSEKTLSYISDSFKFFQICLTGLEQHFVPQTNDKTISRFIQTAHSWLQRTPQEQLSFISGDQCLQQEEKLDQYEQFIQQLKWLFFYLILRHRSDLSFQEQVFLLKIPFTQTFSIVWKTVVRWLIILTGILGIVLSIAYWFYLMPYQAPGNLIVYPNAQWSPSLHATSISNQTPYRFTVNGDGLFHKVRVPIFQSLQGKRIGIEIYLRSERILEVRSIKLIGAAEQNEQTFNLESFQRFAWERFNHIDSGRFYIHMTGILELQAILEGDESLLEKWLLLHGNVPSNEIDSSIPLFSQKLVETLTPLVGQSFKNREAFERTMKSLDVYHTHAGFRLTEQSLSRLKREKISEETIDLLTPLLNENFIDENQFIKVVIQKIGPSSALSLILKHANPKEMQKRKIINTMFRQMSYKQKRNLKDLQPILISPMIDLPVKIHFVEIEARIFSSF